MSIWRNMMKKDMNPPVSRKSRKESSAKNVLWQNGKITGLGSKFSNK